MLSSPCITAPRATAAHLALSISMNQNVGINVYVRVLRANQINWGWLGSTPFPQSLPQVLRFPKPTHQHNFLFFVVSDILEYIIRMVAFTDTRWSGVLAALICLATSSMIVLTTGSKISAISWLHQFLSTRTPKIDQDLLGNFNFAVLNPHLGVGMNVAQRDAPSLVVRRGSKILLGCLKVHHHRTAPSCLFCSPFFERFANSRLKPFQECTVESRRATLTP